MHVIGDRTFEAYPTSENSSFIFSCYEKALSSYHFKFVLSNPTSNCRIISRKPPLKMEKNAVLMSKLNFNWL